MTFESDDDEDRVGFRKPPKKHQFKKGVSGNPKGRPKKMAGEQQIAGVLTETVKVKRKGKVEFIDVSEAYMRSLVTSALNHKKLSAILMFLDLCEQYHLIRACPKPQTHGVLHIPRDWDHDEWIAHLYAFGAPPFPGKRSGLCESPKRPVEATGDDEGATASNEPPPKELTPLEREKAAVRARAQELREEYSKRRHKRRPTPRAILGLIANERPIKTGSKADRSLTTLDLMIRALRDRMFDGNPRAFRRYVQLEEVYGPHPVAETGGFIVLPEPVSAEEAERRAEEQQAPYRGNSTHGANPNSHM